MTRSKKSKVLALAVCLTMLVMAVPFAASATASLTINSIEKSDPDANGLVTIQVAYTASAEVEQVTILAVKGLSEAPAATETNIKYIDQQAASETITVNNAQVTGFEFVVDEDDFSAADPNLFIKLGGTALNSAIPGENPVVIAETSTTFKVYGTVSSAVDTQDFGDEGINEELNDAWKTTVNLKNSFLSDPISTTVVDALSKSYEFTGLNNGTYVLEIKRAGFLSRYVPVTVNNGNVNVGDKTILAGDLNGDYAIDPSDTGLLFSIFGSIYGDIGYSAIYDIFGDGAIDPSDTGAVFSNFGVDVTVYGEDVDFEN